MGTKSLTSRGIEGRFFARLRQAMAANFVSQLAWLNTNTDQETETYRWLGQSPAMREWIGKRQAKGFNDFEYIIKNKKYEATLQIALEDIQRDKTGQIMVRVNEMARRAAVHPWKLIADLIFKGSSTVCYDGQFFFDTDHSEGDSGTQSNDIAVDISALPASQHGSVTAPSTEEMSLVILQAISQMIGFRDDQGEPMNEDAREFLVVGPTSLNTQMLASVTKPSLSGGETNALVASGYKVDVLATPRLSPVTAPWTDEIAVFRTDADMKPFILQEEKPLSLKTQGEGSRIEFDEDKWEFGIDTRRNAGYGLWQYGVLATMI